MDHFPYAVKNNNTCTEKVAWHYLGGILNYCPRACRIFFSEVFKGEWMKELLIEEIILIKVMLTCALGCFFLKNGREMRENKFS